MENRGAAELEASRLEILLVGNGVLVLVAQLAVFIWVGARRHRDQQQQEQQQRQHDAACHRGPRAANRAGAAARRPAPRDAIPYEPRLIRQVRSLVSRVRGQSLLAASPSPSSSSAAAASAKQQQQEKQPACLRRQMAVLEQRLPPPSPPPAAAAEEVEEVEERGETAVFGTAWKSSGLPAVYAGAAPGPATAPREDLAWEPRRGRTRRRASSRLAELRRPEAPRWEVQAC